MAWRSGQSYSADLRSRVLAAVDGGIPARQVAERYRVSVSYIYKALGRRMATGETEARPQRNHQELKLAAHHDALRAEVVRRPDVTLNELRTWLLATDGVAASLGLMHRTLARLGLTLKKSRSARRSRTGPTSPATRRLAGRASPAEPGPAGVRRRDRSRHEHGPPLRPRPPRQAGRRAGAARPLEGHDLRRRASRPAASSPPTSPTGRRTAPSSGPDRADARPGAAARRHRGDGQPWPPTRRPGSRGDRGPRRQLRYLPAYCPDLNPIEQAFTKLKALLRKAAERSVDGLWTAIGRLLDLFPPAECANYLANSGYPRSA